MKKLFQILIIVGFTLIGCNRSPNGNYVVESVSTGGSDYDERMLRQLNKAHFNVQFRDKSLELRSIASGRLTVIPKKAVFGPHTIYETDIMRHDTTFHITMTIDTSLRMEILVFPPAKYSSLPMGASIIDQSVKNLPFASVTCYLARSD